MKFNSVLIGAKSDKGPVRRANEDAFWVSDLTTPTELGALFVVTDGVGGQVHGAAAAHLAVQVISQAFYELRREGAAIPDALEQSIHQANIAVFEQAQARGTGKMGCTLVAAVQHDRRLHIAHVGDARAYLLQGNRLRRLTRDDTWVQKQVEAGIITAADAERHELRNVVTQALGNKPELDVHLAQPQELNSNDRFLLCTDGLHGVLANEYLYRIIKNNRPQDAANILVQSAIEANTQDNVTAVVVDSGRIDRQPTLTNLPATSERVRPRLPLWVLVMLAAAVLVIASLSLYRLVASDNLTIDLGGESGDEVELRVTETSGAPEPTSTQVSPAVFAAPTELPTNVSQTLAPTLQPTTTFEPLLTPEPTRSQMACIVGERQVFVWSDDQVRSNTCNHFSELTLEPGQQVLIVDNDPVPVTGPDRSCRFGVFIKVQSVDDAEIEGWVLESSVRSMGPDGSCSP